MKIGAIAKAITDDKFRKKAPMLRNHKEVGSPKIEDSALLDMGWLEII
jgi:hypothetical protein